MKTFLHCLGSNHVPLYHFSQVKPLPSLRGRIWPITPSQRSVASIPTSNPWPQSEKGWFKRPSTTRIQLLLQVVTLTILLSRVPIHQDSCDDHLKGTMPLKNMNLAHSVCMYWTNFLQSTVHVQHFFWKNSYRIRKLTSLRFFWHLLRQNRSIIWGTVSLWKQ